MALALLQHLYQLQNLAHRAHLVMAQEKTKWLSSIASKFGWGGEEVAKVDQAGFYNAEAMSMTALLGAGKKVAQQRESIYKTYQAMQFDPIISGALRINVTSALGADQETGRMVHIEANAKMSGNKKMAGYAQEVADDLSDLLNKHIVSLAYNGVAFGDSYARIYSKQGKGVTSLCSDEMVMPPLVQPYEMGDKTVVCVIGIGERMRERLSMAQMVRMKLPRLAYIPQPLAVEKAWRTKISEDDDEALPLMPALAGGSFLADAEEQYYRYIATLNGLVNQRILDSIDETIITGQMHGMTEAQQKQFAGNFQKILLRSKEVYEQALKTGQLHAGRIRHFFPTWGEKQQLIDFKSTSSSGGTGAGRAANTTIDDVLLHAKLLSGSLGVDLSMLGFSDMLSGGLGEGGFLRTSVQAAERARMIRVAALESLNHIVDVHMAVKHKIRFEPGQRPWVLKFYGSIAAMESENQRTQMDAANGALLVAQLLSQLKDTGLDAKATSTLLERVAKMDTDDAKLYAEALESARAASKEEDAKAGGFGGGFGGQ